MFLILRYLLRMVKAFGPVRGLEISGWALALHHLPASPASRARPRMFRLPKLAHPIWIRPGTTDVFVLFKIFVEREYDFACWPSHAASVQAAYDSAIAAGQVPIVVDCGANIRLSAIWFAHRFPLARIVAIEPQAENFALLARNAASWGNIVPVQAAVLDRKTKVVLGRPARHLRQANA